MRLNFNVYVPRLENNYSVTCCCCCCFFHPVKITSQFNFLIPWAGQYDSRRMFFDLCFYEVKFIQCDSGSWWMTLTFGEDRPNQYGRPITSIHIHEALGLEERKHTLSGRLTPNACCSRTCLDIRTSLKHQSLARHHGNGKKAWVSHLNPLAL